ncbi:zf-C3HC-domain-containing protein [Cucurbitaria berberidis CBS 394.84]|uniref:Zf-C3HC-domain-containing protein n=1 Tax=Cucurbitaria berberidis CBS 394.84 TaxID=1168544 RepID=A0A9P4GGG7_9PLEO|nr:zf-C3HC-domain-containing protein [Cucurbitaria berberidis CBS 394.84]KAF1845177.1 zf-C3HC-domain-containing protein [Cucurbitaria berberidis CBS 394.84]
MASPDPQPALATTKRKFHKLLDNLTASTSTTSLASTLQEANVSTTSLSQSGSPEPPNKRPRSSNISMERERNISAGQERIRILKEQLLTPRRQATIKVVGSKQTPAESTPRKSPNFQPYSQEQFLARLKTFADVKKWTSKPDAISEVEWAKRGWSCDTWNTVACKGGCEKRVAVKLRPKRKDANGKDIETSEDLSEEVEVALVERYRELIVAAHSDECLWVKRGCQDDIYHIPIASRNKSSAELLTRYNSFTAIAADLPLLENITYPDPPIQDILKRIPSNYFKPPGSEITASPPSSPTEIVAFTFALFGWSGVSESRISLAVCNHCFQRLGLWLSSDARLKEMSKKLDVPIESLRLNLLESHREHCPWKNAEMQGNSGDSPIANMAAWQTLEFMLLGKAKGASSLEKPAHGHNRNLESVDLGSEVTYPRGSLESDARSTKEQGEEGTDSLQQKWKKLKAKLKRSASKKSLKSVKSMRSVKSGKSVVDKDGGKENS